MVEEKHFSLAVYYLLIHENTEQRFKIMNMLVGCLAVVAALLCSITSTTLCCVCIFYVAYQAIAIFILA